MKSKVALAWHTDTQYRPIVPMADTESLQFVKRLIMRHTGNGIELHWIEAGMELQFGWVIGIVETE